MSKAAPQNPPPQKPMDRPRSAYKVETRQLGSNRYEITEWRYDGATDKWSRKLIKRDCARVPAEDEVRIRMEEFIGHQRFGDSGL